MSKNENPTPESAKELSGNASSELAKAFEPNKVEKPLLQAGQKKISVVLIYKPVAIIFVFNYHPLMLQGLCIWGTLLTKPSWMV